MHFMSIVYGTILTFAANVALNVSIDPTFVQTAVWNVLEEKKIEQTEPTGHRRQCPYTEIRPLLPGNEAILGVSSYSSNWEMAKA